MPSYIATLKNIKNPFILFAPFLLAYITIIVLFPTNGNIGDETDYLKYALRLINNEQNSNETAYEILTKGPGYPIILIPFVGLKLPLISITLMNAVFYYLSIIFLFKVINQIISFQYAIIGAIFLALYYNMYENLAFILPEIYTTFLVCLFIYFLTSAFNKEKSYKYVYLSGFILGFIALTKPIFGYVILFIFAGGVLNWVINRKAPYYRRIVTILLVALLTTIPYLIYTYHLTNKIFYWSSLGGNNLYWMSTPFEDEYGDWFPDATTYTDSTPINYKEFIISNHLRDLKEINKFSGIARDEAYKKIAIDNIKNYPVKFFQNCISNVGRIIFNYPYSYKFQKPGTLLRFPLTGIIMVLILFCIIPTIQNWKKIIFPLRFLLFFALIYFGGSILGSAETRMFTPIVPILLIWIAFVFQKTFKIKRKW